MTTPGYLSEVAVDLGFILTMCITFYPGSSPPTWILWRFLVDQSDHYRTAGLH